MATIALEVHAIFAKKSKFINSIYISSLKYSMFLTDEVVNEPCSKSCLAL